MANQTIRAGNSYDIPIAVRQGDGPYQLAGNTFVLTADQFGTDLWSKSMTVNPFGVTTVSDGLTVGPDGTDAGVIMLELTADDTLAMLGWVHWSLAITSSDNNVNDAIQGAFNVLAETPYIVPYGVSRLDVRRQILQKLGDLIVATATENGTTSTFIDRRRLIGEPNAYRGMSALITTLGDNQGEERYVTGSSRDNRSISFDYELPSITTTGTEVELINFRGNGYHFDDVNRAISTAVIDAADTAPEPAMMRVASDFVRVPGTVPIPDDWVIVSGVQWRDADDQPWQNMAQSSRQLGSGWSVDRANRVVNIGQSMGYRVEDKALQIVGFRKPTPPEIDSDLIGINTEWIVSQCVAMLSQAAFRRNPTPERQQTMAMDEQEAAILRSRVLRRSGPNVVRL